MLANLVDALSSIVFSSIILFKTVFSILGLVYKLKKYLLTIGAKSVSISLIIYSFNSRDILSKCPRPRSAGADRELLLSSAFVYVVILSISAIGGSPFLIFRIVHSVVSRIERETVSLLLEGSKFMQSSFPLEVIAKPFNISVILLNSILSKYFFSIIKHYTTKPQKLSKLRLFLLCYEKC